MKKEVVESLDEVVAVPPEQAEAGISAQLAAIRTGLSGIKGNVYSKIVQGLIYATVVLLPLFYLPFTSGVLEYNKQILLVVVASVGLIVWFLGVVVNGKLTMRSTPLDKGVLALAAASLIASLFSLTVGKSIFGLSVSLSSSFLTVLCLSVFYLLMVNTLHDRGRMLRQALSTSVAVALLLGVFQMLTWYFLPGSFTHSRAFNTVGSINALGILAAVALPLLAKTANRIAGQVQQIVSVAGVVLALVVLAILNWWVLWAVAVVGMLAMIAFDSLNATRLAEDYGKSNRFALGRFIVPISVIVLAAFLLLVKFNASVKTNFPVEVAPSYSLSTKVAKGVLGQRLLFGYGPENFSIAFDKFGAGSLANTQLSSVRFFDGTGEVFNIIVHEGVVGLVALGLLLWCLVQVAMRFGGAISESVSRGDGATFANQTSGTLAALAALTVGFFLYPFNLVLMFVWYVLLGLAALAITGDRSKTIDIEEKPMYSLSASLGFIVALIAVLTGVYFTSVLWLADVRYAHAVTSTDTNTAMTGVVRALSLDPSSDRYYRDASQLALALLRTEVAKTGTDPERTARVQNLISSSIQLAQRAAQAAPLESVNWSNLGQIYQSMTGLVQNVEQLAQDAFKKAGDLRPGDPTFDNQIGQMWLARADLLRSLIKQAGANAARVTQQANDSLANAEKAFKDAIAKSDTYGLAIYNLGAVYDRQGKVKEAITQLEKIAPYNANEPTLMFELGLLYVRDQQKDNALAALQRAVLLAPQYANARWYLALLYEERNDIPSALAQLREISKSNPDNADLKTKIAQLEAGQRAIPPARVIDEAPLQ